MRMPSLRMSPEMASVVDQLVDADRPPSHDELSRIFDQAGVRGADPTRGGERFGKVKRVRAVASWCLDNDRDKGGRLVSALVSAVRAEGGFAAGSETHVGDEVVANLRRALQSVGYTIDDDGVLAPQLLDNVPEVEQHAALAQYADRIRRGAADSPLVTGSGKDLLEAAARHVILQHGTSYSERMGLPGTLLQAYTSLGLTPPPPQLVQGQGLAPDPVAQIEQAVFLLGTAVNRLRNAQGTGHGRPYPPSVTERQAELASQAIALATELLLRPR